VPVTELHVVEIFAVLRQLTAQLIASDDLDDALAHLVDTAAGLVAGEAWCGVTLVRTGGPCTAAASVGLPAKIDEEQYTTGDGPSMQAMSTGEMVMSVDLTHETRWPEWLDRARSGGVHGVLSVPVDIDDQVIGALSLYTADPDRLTPDIGLTAMLVAEHAGLLLAAVLDRGRMNSLNEELTEALGDGEMVNRAIGIVMAQRACTAEAALDVLRETAGRLHLPLWTVAERLVDTITSRSISRQA
jgi:transcriptional regulator with GAF, ATPase, and Fis domain